MEHTHTLIQGLVVVGLFAGLPLSLIVALTVLELRR